jgi:hypothetical protein
MGQRPPPAAGPHFFPVHTLRLRFRADSATTRSAITTGRGRCRTPAHVRRTSTTTERGKAEGAEKKWAEENPLSALIERAERLQAEQEQER